MKHVLQVAAMIMGFIVSLSAVHADLIRPGIGQTPFQPRFYSFKGREHKITYQAIYKADRSLIDSLMREDDIDARDKAFSYSANGVFKFLMGPATHRVWGGPKKIESVKVDWSGVKYSGSEALVPYTYEATWILDQSLSRAGVFQLPVPYNTEDLLTSRWKKCTDSEPEHQTESFYWYFWDPTRYGCDHVEGKHYQHAKVTVGDMTENQAETYPEFERMIKEVNGRKEISMTFAFGYVSDSDISNPQTDGDSGAGQYRNFLTYVERSLPGFAKKPITKSDYNEFGSLVIGRQYTGQRNGIDYTVKVVISAGVDQMKLFAKSFAQDHDGFFAWFGHSRVGSGFDAEQFGRIVRNKPEQYSITSNYQIVYWGGCNSYTYYTLPFFKFKSDLDPEGDPSGTKNLDIISNGMPSYFSLNMPNAQVSLDILMKWPIEKTSYQTWIRKIEEQSWSQAILTNVLGDEDNAR